MSRAWGQSIIVNRGEILRRTFQERQIIMRNRKLKLISAGIFVSCALGLVTLKLAWATPQQGAITTVLTDGPISLGEINVHFIGDPAHKLKIQTMGVSDIYVVRHVIAPGGDTGWYSTPGPSIISVVAGEVTAYAADNPQGVVFTAGTAFTAPCDQTHIFRNEGTVNLELIAFQINPEGAPRQIDEDAP